MGVLFPLTINNANPLTMKMRRADNSGLTENRDTPKEGGTESPITVGRRAWFVYVRSVDPVFAARADTLTIS
ncbi:MAG: hypothetical protein WCD28_13310, partial [Nitrososphaeraceae archaeon]